MIRAALLACCCIAWQADAETCYRAEHLAAFAKQRGMSLKSWGIDDTTAQTMLELYEGPGGFAIISTRPDHCATMQITMVPLGRLAPRTMGDRPDDKVGPRPECIDTPLGKMCHMVEDDMGRGDPT